MLKSKKGEFLHSLTETDIFRGLGNTIPCPSRTLSPSCSQLAPHIISKPAMENRNP
jgi:hypothetical protein